LHTIQLWIGLIEKSPHEIVYSFRLRQLIDLISIYDHIRASDSVLSFASHVHDLHKKVMNKIAPNYKLRANVRKRFKIFNVGDYVNVWIRLEWFSPGTIKKLHTRSAGSFQIIKKLNDNTYVIDLPQDFDISSIFNIKDLVNYKGPDFNPSNPLDDEPSLEPISERLSLPPLLNILPNTVDQIYKIMDDEIITTEDSGIVSIWFDVKEKH